MLAGYNNVLMNIVIGLLATDSVHSYLRYMYVKKFARRNSLSCAKDCIEDVATFTTLAKKFHELFLQYKGTVHVAGLGEMFIH